MKIEDVSLRIIQIESNLQPAPDSHHLSLSHNLEAHATVQWFQTSFLPHSNCHNSWAKFPPYLSISGLLPVFFHNYPIENIWKWLENPAPGHIFQPFSYIFIHIFIYVHIFSPSSPTFCHGHSPPIMAAPSSPRRHGVAVVSTQRVVDHPLLLTLRAVPGTQGTCEAGLSWRPIIGIPG